MKLSRKSKRVTWAPDLNLCQVRLFLAEDCPSKVSMQTQDHLQKKTSFVVHHLNGKEFNDLPPGFEGSCNLNPLLQESYCIPKIDWKCPPQVVMSHNWNVAAGEESREAEAQKFREMRVLEAVFPRASAIPPSPFISLGIEGEYYDDSLTPTIPLTPIEEAAAADIQSELSALQNTCLSSQSPEVLQDLLSGTCNNPALRPLAGKKPMLGKLLDMGADLITAASAAAAALKKSMDGSLIDTDLLEKIFSDPKMIEKLVNDGQAFVSKPATILVPPSCPIPSVISSGVSVDGNLCGPGRFKLKATPMPCTIASPCHESTKIPMPMVADRSFYPPLDEVQPMVTRLPPQPEMAAAVYLPGPEFIIPLNCMSAASNTCSMPDQVRTAASAITVQSIAVPKLSVELNHSLVLPNLAVMPAQPKPSSAPKSNMVTIETNPIKDINYIKNLIREHGSEKKESVNRIMSVNSSQNYIQNIESEQNVMQKEVRPKFQKPCIYYGSSKGCRNGSNCLYLHDLSFQFHDSEAMVGPIAKRMKFCGEITGRI